MNLDGGQQQPSGHRQEDDARDADEHAAGNRCGDGPGRHRGGGPPLGLHDLRHTDATLLPVDDVPARVGSERLGHADATITLTVHRQVYPGMGREAADRFTALLEG